MPEIAINQEPTNKKQADKKPESSALLKTGTASAAITTNLIDPKEVGHNIYILAHQLSRHNEELAALLNPDTIKEPNMTKTALEFYRAHTANIEVSNNLLNLTTFFFRLFVPTVKWKESFSQSTTFAHI